MKLLDLPLKTLLEQSLDEVRNAPTRNRQEAVGRYLKRLMAALPENERAQPIAEVKWSNGFVTNARWQAVWRSLGVRTLGDLGASGNALAETRGIGQGKLLSLLQDLLELATYRPSPPGSGITDRRVAEAIRRALQEVDEGPPTPHPHRAGVLLRALVASLPERVKSQRLDSVPWSSEWCYGTTLWQRLGVITVADLGQVGVALARSKGIGRGKVVSIATDLIALVPELNRALFPNGSPSSTPRPVRSAQRASGSAPAGRGRLIEMLDHLAEGLNPRERDVFHRRLGWRYEKPRETLKVLALEHDVTQERIRQVEFQLRRRAGRLLTLEGLPGLLQEALAGRPGPVELESIVSCSPKELQGMMEVWKPLASLLAAEGGPYLGEERGHVVVSRVPLRGRRSSRQKATAQRASLESSQSWPTTPRHCPC